MIRAVIFDIGGPLDLETQFEATIDAHMRQALADEGFVVDDQAFAEAKRWAIEHFAPNLYRAVIWRLTSRDQLAAQRIFETMGARGRERDFFELRDGICEVLSALHDRGLLLGLAANQPARALEKLSEAGIGHYFTNRGVTGVYGYRKPDVRLFLRACGDLGVQPDECIMVGDRIDNDVAPAKILGMKTVLIRTGQHRDQQPRSWDEVPDLEIRQTEDLLPAILSLLGGNEA